MKTKREHLFNFKMKNFILKASNAGPASPGSRRAAVATLNDERGNALVYVLIAIVLFAALSFTLSRQNDAGETGTLTEEKAELYASQLISYAAQAKQSVDRMLFEGATPAQIDFIPPSDAAFETGSDIRKLYHPDGGGLIESTLPDSLVNQIDTTPVAGWYIGRFNDMAWTELDSSGNPIDDIILTAHQISQGACEKINNKILGRDIAIPALASGITLQNVLIDDTEHSGSNVNLNATNCPGCENYPSLCISNNGATKFSFYSILSE